MFRWVLRKVRNETSIFGFIKHSPGYRQYTCVKKFHMHEKILQETIH